MFTPKLFVRHGNIPEVNIQSSGTSGTLSTYLPSNEVN